MHRIAKLGYDGCSATASQAMNAVPTDISLDSFVARAAGALRQGDLLRASDIAQEGLGYHAGETALA